MPLLMSSYSEEALYLSNSTAHVVSLIGGSTAVHGRHSTMESPESVRSGAAPTTPSRTSRAPAAQSQTRIARRCALAVADSAGDCAPSVSVALESRFFFSDKGLIRPFKVPRLHADRLRQRFRFDGLVDAHAPFLLDASLGRGMRECGPVRKRLRQCLRLAHDCIGLT